MVTRVWIGPNGGDWADPTNWQGTIVPGPGDDVTIQSTLVETIIISSSDTIGSLIFNDPAATLDVLNSGTIVATGSIDISAGSVIVAGYLDSAGPMTVSASGAVNVSGSLAASVLTLDAGEALQVAGTITVGTIGSAATIIGGTLTAGTLTTDTLAGGTITTSTIGAIILDGTNIPTEITPLDTPPCFAAGTRIGTDHGAVPVERLAPGDHVRVVGGDTAPIVWIGRRRIDLRRHPIPERVRPIRIAPHAFGYGRPHRPLFLSPDHAVFMDGVLIPIKFLLNEITITQVARPFVTYYHIELDHHDVVLAEDLPVETYLETGQRTAFENAEPCTQLHPEFASDDASTAVIWEREGYAPLLGNGQELDAVRRRLALQAALLRQADHKKAIG